MKLTEKIAYMKGYMEGLELDKATKESKVIAMMADVMWNTLRSCIPG